MFRRSVFVCLVLCATAGCVSGGAKRYDSPELKALGSLAHMSERDADAVDRVVFIFDCSTSTVLEAIRKNIGSLEFVCSRELRMDSVRARKNNSRTAGAFRGSQMIARNRLLIQQLGPPSEYTLKREPQNFANLRYDVYRVPFLPPRVPLQRISRGFVWFRCKTEVVMEVGSSEEFPNRTFVLARRRFLYSSMMRFRSTEIPIPLFMADENSTLLESDVAWFRRLARAMGVSLTEFDDAYPFEKDVYENLVGRGRSEDQGTPDRSKSGQIGRH